MSRNTFEVGDKIVKAAGKKPLVVEWVSDTRVNARYLHSGQVITDYASSFKLYEEDGSNMASGKEAIYKVQYDQNTEFFANYRGLDSAGNWLMERIGDGGGIFVVSKDKVEEQLPYTFSVRMNGREQHFQGEAGKVKKGDILLFTSGGVDNFAFAVVKNVDTKQKGARAWEGVRVITESL